ncbi:hypothetical protein NDA00_11840 [Funiculus sociatus GB2-M2]|uniref:hypothetical protein n=1 Tax=Cyanophyceae TaxID=3028117 RepID=UPI0018F04553|nr:hypothetical protein [Trichocoleus sp. FACHB-90]
MVERDVRVEKLGNFDGAFLAATVMEWKPLASIHPHWYDSASQPLFCRFLPEFREISH